MSEPFIGEIRMFAGNFAPNGWAFCNGQLLSIAQNTALFSLLGTTYGGNGITTFALPDLRGRVSIGFSQGPGLSPYAQGETGGVEAHALTVAEMASHNHVLAGTTAPANNTSPSGRALGETARPLYSSTAPAVDLAPESLSQVGGSQPHPNMKPYLTVSFIIALVGIFPSRP